MKNKNYPRYFFVLLFKQELMLIYPPESLIWMYQNVLHYSHYCLKFAKLSINWPLQTFSYQIVIFRKIPKKNIFDSFWIILLSIRLQAFDKFLSLETTIIFKYLKNIFSKNILHFFGKTKYFADFQKLLRKKKERPYFEQLFRVFSSYLHLVILVKNW